MINYDQACRNIFASGTMPDGFDGQRVKVKFSLIGQKIVIVCHCGCFNAGLPDVIDKKEAYWILNNHPLADRYKNINKCDW